MKNGPQDPDKKTITRFAPSPTGPLHLGHAYAALVAWDMAVETGGDFLLRIEDIDQSRARPHWEARIYDDLRWLGLWWPEPVMRQSDNLPRYRAALEQLWAADLVYPCTCTRRDIQQAASAPHEGTPPHGPDGVIYPGTCRRARARFAPDPLPQDAALRLDMRAALDAIARRPFAAPLHFTETGAGPARRVTIGHDQAIETIGDVVLARRDMGTSYHLSVVLDDATQGITHVTRGRDLYEATAIHVILQRLLDLPTPVYHHHRLIRDDAGQRLAKRDDARAIATYRDQGASQADIRRLVGL
jgi:glutamyl-Q tRNA(Asp) synthetase